MATIIRKNERSWAIELISELNIMLSSLDLLVKKAGGESTLATDRESMFPDVLLYGDKSNTQIMQGWEIKLPDTLITDIAFINDAERKARVLGLDSFFIWNFTSGVLYSKDEHDRFLPLKSWNETNHIKSRADVELYKKDWLPLIKSIVLEINSYFGTGKFNSAGIGQIISDKVMLTIIKKNQSFLGDYLRESAKKDTKIRSVLNIWWDQVKVEYAMDAVDLFHAYAKVILLSWINRLTFANIIKKYYMTAKAVELIETGLSPKDANDIFNKITDECDFFNIFVSIDYSEILPKATWDDLIDFNMFLKGNGIDQIEQDSLQSILENTVNISKREVCGQYATPAVLAELITRITVLDLTKNCLDPCCGTGTIAKAILDMKTEALGAKAAYESTWASDKFAFPLQISNLSLVRADAINLPSRIFQNNVFSLRVGHEISITDPKTGDLLDLKLPEIYAITSNLPFVPFEYITEDEKKYIQDLTNRVHSNTNIQLLGRSDLYSYIPFALWDILEDNGRIGIIVSNSWLGTEWGNYFFEALSYYYNIKNVLISGSGRWFNNADIVTTIIILEKKNKIFASDESISFSVLSKNLDDLEKTADMMNKAVDSLILSKEIDESVLKIKPYTISQIQRLNNLGISKNALFHGVEWLDEISNELVPITTHYKVSRGERRGQNDLFYPKQGHQIEPEYIKPVLKNPRRLTGLIASTDIEAFCCNKSVSELIRIGDKGAFNWVKKFEGLTNGTGIPLPIVLNRTTGYWYEMSDSAKTDMVTILNPNQRLFVSKFNESTFVDQRFTCINRKNEKTDLNLGHALLNTILGMFYIEAIGFGRGLGVLDTSSTNFRKIYMLNPDFVSSEQRERILKAFEPMLHRTILNTSEEINSPDREAFDRLVLSTYGIEKYYGKIKETLLSMQSARLSVR